MKGDTTKWTSVTLDSLTDDDTPITYGVVKPGEEGDVPFIRGGDISGGRILIDQLRTISREVSVQYRRTLLRGGEILISLVGNPGQVAIAPPELVGANIARQVGLVRLKPNVDPRFVSYFLRSPQGQAAFGAQSLGSVQQVINLRDLKTVKVPLPPLAEQKRIAGILGALDDKIELNRKMNETLEQMVKALFKSWFVDFDPIHAKAAGRQPVGMDKATADLFPDSFVDSELGNVPKGWRVGTLDELVELRTERIAATPAKDGMRYLALEDMPSRSLDVSQFQPGSAVNSSIIKFLEGDILLGAMRPYFHKVGLAFFDGITRSTTMVLTPKKCFLRHFALLHVFSDELIRYATTASIGTTMPYVKWDSLAKYQIIIPTEELLARFDEQAGRLIIMIGNNGNESRLLAEMRDLLIPQLLSGECNA
jgi:type I restriction enzyme S subunit